MRLVTRKLWRAFPELDPFDDQQASSFVRSARRSLRARLVRWTLSLSAGGVLLIGPLVGCVALLQTAKHFQWWHLLLALLAFTPGPVVTMLVRDRVLRRQIKRILRTQGTCPSCRYNLLGAPVSPELKVACPECGLVTTVDPALGELVTTAHGATIYQPKVHLDDPGQIARRARRRKLLVRTVAGVVLTPVLIVASFVATWHIQTLIDARDARADRNVAPAITALVQSAQPAGTGDPEQGWLAFAKLVTELDQDIHAAFTKEARRDRHAQVPDSELRFEADAAFNAYKPVGDPEVDGPRQAGHDARRQIALTVLSELDAAGTLTKLNQLQTISRAARPPQVPVGESAITIGIPTLNPARAVTRLCVALAARELQAGNIDAYAAHTDQALAIARVLEMQGTLIDRLVASSIENRVAAQVRADLAKMPDESWVARVQSVLAERRPRVPLDHALEAERLAAADVAAWFFSDPAKVRKTAFTGTLPMLGPMRSGGPTRVGRYRATVQEMNQMAQHAKALAALEPFARPAGWSDNGEPREFISKLVFGMTPRVLRIHDQHQVDLRGTRVMLAIERFTRRTGARPKSLSELSTADGLDPADLIDPFSGKPFGYRTIDRASPQASKGRHPIAQNGGISDVQATLDNYLLWTVGFDGVDDGGTHGAGHLALMPMGASYDHVINNSD